MGCIFKILLALVTVFLSLSAVNSRIQLKQPEEINVERIPNGPPCILDINKDLPFPQPLHLQPGSTEFWPVGSKSQLQIPRGESLELQCTKNFRLKPSHKSINATCSEDKTFIVNNEKVPFQLLNCTAPVKYKVREANNTCAANANLYEIGFELSTNRFIRTISICHDKSTVNTLWTFNKLKPENVHFQKSVQRLNFSKAGFFDKRNMNHIYSKENQKKVFENLLGSNYVKFFDNRTQFLSRGHLSSKADHIYGSQQRATFNFFNAAPQWQIFNAGTWSAVENGIRRFLETKKIEVDCYTGTWGVISLPNSKGESKDIYLTVDENNNGEVPVPKLFYKLIVDTKSSPQKGVVLIGVNNPYVTMDDLKEDYLICNDISEWVPWIRWKRDNIAKGYFFACRVDDFIRVVDELPKSLKNVHELLV
ncbi:uncharacterized protein LOC129918787 [Episyrphus balteatus]|uniref:uncharacterized protein LOC129918787 n=1 Tax=Episyrphus balteatus TaxID=286459 RepID=UPI002485A24C|nr:uncharacterized protein LOC129918787 [Episyrphus balteatus]